jgi:hypothetical protein
MENPIYLGDAVYATILDTGSLMLTTGSHRKDEASDTIYLEPSVWESLVRFVASRGDERRLSTEGRQTSEVNQFSEKTKPVIVSLTQTSAACPSEWDGKTEDGKSVYIRYRWGRGGIEIDGETIGEWSGGAGWGDGIISEEEMKEKLSHVVEWRV